LFSLLPPYTDQLLYSGAFGALQEIKMIITNSGEIKQFLMTFMQSVYY